MFKLNCEPNNLLSYLASLTAKSQGSHSGFSSNSTLWYYHMFSNYHSSSTCWYLTSKPEHRCHVNPDINPIQECDAQYFACIIPVLSASRWSLQDIVDIKSLQNISKTCHRQHYTMLLCYSPSTISWSDPRVPQLNLPYRINRIVQLPVNSQFSFYLLHM